MFLRVLTLLALSLLFGFPVSELHAQSQKMCIKNRLKVKKNNRVVLKRAISVTTTTCPSGTTEILDTSSFKGDTGPVGADGADGSDGDDGADGQLRIYGDGSDGALVVSSDMVLNDGLYQFSSVQVNAGETLDIGSGAVIRVTGTFNNDGTIDVYQFASGGDAGFVLNETQLLSPEFAPPSAGISKRPAAIGEFGDNTALLSGGLGGGNLQSYERINVLNPGHLGGGGGGGRAGGFGGGALVILSQGAFTNSATGTINANGNNGSSGSGGGAGGVLVMASPTSITNDGNINAIGGNGGSANSSQGAGGGGGGGIVNLVSPSITDNGTIDVSGGTGASSVVAGTITSIPRLAGGGGGACGGFGGAGGAVDTDDSGSSGSNGSAGDSNQIVSDPTALF